MTLSGSRLLLYGSDEPEVVHVKLLHRMFYVDRLLLCHNLLSRFAGV